MASNVGPTSAMNTSQVGIPAGWTQLYTRDGQVRLVPDDHVEKAMREEGLLPMRYDLDNALAEWQTSMRAALDAVPKALGEMIATGYERDEDAAIINHSMTSVRDAFATLLFAAGALLPSESEVAALKEYLEDEPKRAAMRAQIAGLEGSGQPVPEELFENAYGSEKIEARAKQLRQQISSFPQDRHEELKARSLSDESQRAQTATAEQLAARRRQIAINNDGSLPVYEVENGVFMRKDEDDILYPADVTTGEFVEPVNPDIGEEDQKD